METNNEYPMPPGFYNMDCMEAMRQFSDGFFDLACVDPPYGIGITGAPGGGNSKGLPLGFGGGRGIVPPKVYHAFDDQKIPEKEYFDELRRVSRNQIIWGGNYFLNYLGSTQCMIFWDKGRDGLNFADGEIAWTSFKQPVRRFAFKWNGLLQGDMKNKETRIHPTQKPVRLYSWIFSRYAKHGDKILDTHVGSASSLIAAHRAHLTYWGFEIDKVYYEMAKERLEAETAQLSFL